MNLFKKKYKNLDMHELLNNGALLLDVRTRGEYSDGNVQGSKNIPLDELAQSLSQMDKKQVTIVVCASGARSSRAVNLLKQNGFTNCHNGGSWMNFNNKVD